jgi:hypothetical protein
VAEYFVRLVSAFVHFTLKIFDQMTMTLTIGSAEGTMAIIAPGRQLIQVYMKSTITGACQDKVYFVMPSGRQNY